VVAPKLAGGDEPLTVYSGPGPVDLSLLSLHESRGYLFARYALPATSARREGTPSLR
jgi:hypothetical protein